MKSLNLLNNEDRVKLILSLFPDQIPPLMATIKEVCRLIGEEREEITKTWNNPIISASHWFALADSVLNALERITKNNVRKNISPTLFSGQTANGLNALFTIHCIGVYAKSEACKNKKFQLVVKAFFEYSES